MKIYNNQWESLTHKYVLTTNTIYENQQLIFLIYKKCENTTNHWTSMTTFENYWNTWKQFQINETIEISKNVWNVWKPIRMYENLKTTIHLVFLKTFTNHYNACRSMIYFSKSWKSLKTNLNNINIWQCMKINENHNTSSKIEQRQWKSWTCMKIN